jgi:hypothetical protein
MDVSLVLGMLGSVASIVSLFLPATGKRGRLVHAIYVLAITLISGTAIYYQQQNSRAEHAKHFATKLLQDENNGEYTSTGFNMAALAFLEMNKDLFPDSYRNAQQLCNANNCLGAQYGNAAQDSLEHAFNQTNVEHALKGLVRGIAASEGT